MAEEDFQIKKLNFLMICHKDMKRNREEIVEIWKKVNQMKELSNNYGNLNNLK